MGNWRILKGGGTLHKAFSFVLSLLLVVTLLPAISVSAYAQDSGDHSDHGTVTASWEIGDLTPANVTATLYDDGCFVVSGTGDTKAYDWTDGNVDAWMKTSTCPPWLADGYNDQIESVVFEEGVTPTSLAYWFYECSNLTSVSNLPDSVTNMYCTFYYCASLVEVSNIPSFVTSLDYAFFCCTSLVEAPLIPSTVSDMSYTFYGCTSLVEAPDIPDSVTSLRYTFYGCSSLVKAPEIPDSVTGMWSTFEGCTSLVEAPEIPNSVTIMWDIFCGCTSLVEAPEIPSSVTDMSGAFAYCISLVEAPVIPDSVTDMFGAFYGCTSLVEAPLIPSTVTDMSWAFADCESLTSLPDGFSFPEGADITGAFTFPSLSLIPDENIVTYCSADDYEALLAAYDWEDSQRTLVARDDSQNPDADDPIEPDESDEGEGDDAEEVTDPDDSEDPILTYSGSTRYETASWIVSQEILIAQSLGVTFEGIIVANGDDSHFADALAASGLSGLLNYPIVLTSDDSLSSYAESVISQIAASADEELKIIILGDDNSISQTARTQLDAYGDLVELQGDNRYATAQAIYDYGAEAANWNTEYTIITTGEKFPDALSIASYAAYANARVVLVNGTLDSLTESTAAEIADSENIIILGDSNAVSEGIENELIGTFGEDKVTRLQGENRYETSAAVAAWALGQGMTLEGAGFATGEKPADALASSSLLGMTGSVLLLVSPTSSNNTAALELLEANADDVSTINIFGDTNSVSTATISSITSALGWE